MFDKLTYTVGLIKAIQDKRASSAPALSGTALLGAIDEYHEGDVDV
jgi:hypothetical protein